MKKVYYAPGLISLTLLAGLFFYFSNHYIRVSQVYAITTTWADIDFTKSRFETFPPYRDNYPPARVYLPVDITNEQQTNQAKFAIAEKAIRELTLSKDTLKGVHFRFDQQADYQSFITALDICRRSGARSYMIFGTNIWIVNFPEIKEDTTTVFLPFEIICETRNYTTTVKKSLRTHPKSLAQIWHSSWQMMIGFLLLVFFAVRSIFRAGTRDRKNKHFQQGH